MFPQELLSISSVESWQRVPQEAPVPRIVAFTLRKCSDATNATRWRIKNGVKNSRETAG